MGAYESVEDLRLIAVFGKKAENSAFQLPVSVKRPFKAFYGVENRLFIDPVLDILDQPILRLVPFEVLIGFHIRFVHHNPGHFLDIHSLNQLLVRALVLIDLREYD